MKGCLILSYADDMSFNTNITWKNHVGVNRLLYMWTLFVAIYIYFDIHDTVVA